LKLHQAAHEIEHSRENVGLQRSTYWEVRYEDVSVGLGKLARVRACCVADGGLRVAVDPHRNVIGADLNADSDGHACSGTNADPSTGDRHANVGAGF
jgi:hypothetical protein